MSLASEITTCQEPAPVPNTDGVPAVRLRTRVRTNAGVERFKRRLERLGLLPLAESIVHYETNWHWSGTGQGYEILWRDTATFADLLPLRHL